MIPLLLSVDHPHLLEELALLVHQEEIHHQDLGHLQLVDLVQAIAEAEIWKVKDVGNFIQLMISHHHPPLRMYQKFIPVEI